MMAKPGQLAEHGSKDANLHTDLIRGADNPPFPREPRAKEQQSLSPLLWGGAFVLLLAFILMPRSQPYYA